MKFTTKALLLLSYVTLFAGADATSENNHLRGKRNLHDDDARGLQEDCLSASMLDSAKILQFGYQLNDKPLTPVSKHSGDRPIFDADKIHAYVNENFISEDIGETISVIEEKMSSFSSEMQSKMSIEGTYGSEWLGGSLTSSAAAEFGLSKGKDTESYFAQRRKFYTFGTVQLPFESENKTEIQDLMDEYTLQELMGVTTSERAEELVNYLGIGYLHKSYFGATFVMTTTIEKEQWMYKSLVSAAMSASYESFVGNAAKGEASSSMGIEKGGNSAKTQVNLRVEGGDPTMIENVSEWKKSAENRPVITEYTIKPIYELLSASGSESEATARRLLKEAVNKTIVDFEGSMPNFDGPNQWKTMYRDSEHGVVSQLSRKFSEEGGGLSGRVNNPIYGITCEGSNCDLKSLRYAVMRENLDGAVKSDDDNVYWTSWYRDVGRNVRKCPADKVVNQIKCRGPTCNEMRLECAPMADGFRVDHDDTMETAIFGSKQREEMCDDGYYVYGIGCFEYQCDSIQLYCARVQYRNNTMA